MPETYVAASLGGGDTWPRSFVHQYLSQLSHLFTQESFAIPLPAKSRLVAVFLRHSFSPAFTFRAICFPASYR